MDGVPVKAVLVSLRDWDTEFLHRMDALVKRTGRPVATFAVREHGQAPRGSVLIYMDPDKLGRAVLCHHRADWEWVHQRLNAMPGMKLTDLEAIQVPSEQRRPRWE